MLIFGAGLFINSFLIVIIVENLEEFKIEEGLAATTGFFDGVHLGHQFMLGELKRIASERGLSTAVVTFAEHPRRALHDDFQPLLLNELHEKLEKLENTGIDYCLVMKFSPEFASLSAEEYIRDILHERCGVRTLLAGYDHRFGRGRADGLEDYKEYGRKCGMEVIGIGRFSPEGANVSSSVIRRLLLSGDTEEAAAMLTYPYRMRGRVVDGHKIGRTLGFPTMNVRLHEPLKLIPAAGVYSSEVFMEGEDIARAGMLYIGNRPTFESGGQAVIEVHIINYSGEDYGRSITIDVGRRIRGDIRFKNTGELVRQLSEDRRIILNLFKNGK